MNETKAYVNPLARFVRPTEPIEPVEPLRLVEGDGGCDALLRGLTAGGHYEAGGLLGIDADASEIVEAVRKAMEDGDATKS